MSAATARPPTVKAWHIHTHLARLFAGRPPPTSARAHAPVWSSLDGFRGTLCIWMVAFHSLFYAINFVPDETLYRIGLDPALIVLTVGFFPVDAFFVLTGFLIAYPLFQEEVKRIQLLNAGASKKTDAPATANDPAAAASSSIWSFDLRTFYYRRVTRMVPSYILAVIFHCWILFPHGVQHSMEIVRSNGFRNLMQRVLPGLTDAPNGCTPEKLFVSFAWMNHLMPFGGCMGWTWSFALQFNFYLFFPLLWAWAHRRLARRSTDAASQASASMRTPSSYVLPFLYAFLLVGLAIRILTFFQMRLYDLRHEESLFLGFFWYSNTFTRGGAIVWGVLIAYWSLHTRLIEWARARPHLVTLGWIVAALILGAQMFWSRIFVDGNMVETPGWGTLELTQRLGGPESLVSLAHTNMHAYWYHALFHVFGLVGSPGSNLLCAFLLFVIVNGIGWLGAHLQSFFSLRVWYPISTLSWWVYLVHPALMMKFYSFVMETRGELPASVPMVFINAGIQLALSFGTATLAHLFFEQPLEILLRRTEATKTDEVSATSSRPVSRSTFYTRLRSVIFVYCCACMVYIVLHHIAMLLAVWTALEPKEYVPLPDALPERPKAW